MSNGELIRQARKRKNWTQGDLAKALGITHVNVAQWENGTRNPKTETLERIAEALDIDPLDLMDGNERLSYIEQFGSTANRIQNAIQELLEILQVKKEDAEFCGGFVTSTCKRKWTLDALDEIAPKNHVSKEQLRAELGLDNNRIDFNDKEDWSQQEKIVQEIGHILKKMNATGQTAVLRHANELSKIPDYQKKGALTTIRPPCSITIFVPNFTFHRPDFI